MFCVKCGNKLHDGDLFCAKCGNKVLLADDSFASKVRTAKVYKEYFGFNSNDKIVVNFDDIDTVEFGKYPQNDVTGKTSEKISWFVLDKDLSNNKALLISKYSLDVYQEQRDTYRYWNYFKIDYFDEFVHSLIFTETEKENIIESDVINKPFKINGFKYGMSGGNTKEKIFILNLEETIKYMYAYSSIYYNSSNANWVKEMYKPNIRRFNKWMLTKYAQNKVKEQVRFHLIRNYLVDFKIYMLVIDNSGYIESILDADADGKTVGIRPAMWVKI